MEQIDYYGAGSTRAKSGGGTQNISGWIKHAETMSYDQDGRLLSQTSKGRVKNWVASSSATGQGDLSQLSTLTVTTQRYDGLSRSSGYTWNYKEHDETYAGSASDAKNYTHTYAITYEGRDGYQEKSNYGYSSNSNFKASTATSQYDAWGRLIAVREHTPKQSDIDDRVRYMSLDGDGMILRRREGTYQNNAFSQTTAEKGRDAVFTYGSGQQLAEQTRDGTKLDVFGLMGMRDAGPASKDQQKFINKQARKGNVMGAYDKIAQRYSVYGQDGASRVQVQSGDSLQGIAQRVYGNSSLWYVLAAANALSGDSELIAGTQLRVPEVGVSKNDANTFKPYNPNEIIGSTSPSLPYIPPPGSLSCKQTMILLATTIVRVVATFYGGVGGAMLADALMQKVEINAGIRSEYSLGETVAAGVFAFFAPAIQGATGWARAGYAALAAATAYTGSFLVDKSRGADVHFNWGNLAASVVTSMISTKLGAVGNTGVAAGGTVSSTLNSTAFSWAKVASDAVKNLAISVVNKGVTQLITGDKAQWDAGAMFADSFGNALGSELSVMLNKKILSSAERKALNAMSPESRKEYEALRAQGKSPRQAFDYMTNAGGLRAMGEAWFAIGKAANNDINIPTPSLEENSISFQGLQDPVIIKDMVPVPDGTIKDTVSWEVRSSLATKYVRETEAILSKLQFKSEESAARAFRNVYAPVSGYLGLEFGANIVPKEGKYILTDIVRSTTPSGKSNLGWDAPIPNNDFATAYAHTHPDLYFINKRFSYGDLQSAIDRSENAYVFYPDGYGRKFDFASYQTTASISKPTLLQLYYYRQDVYAKPFK